MPSRLFRIFINNAMQPMQPIMGHLDVRRLWRGVQAGADDGKVRHYLLLLDLPRHGIVTDPLAGEPVQPHDRRSELNVAVQAAVVGICCDVTVDSWACWIFLQAQLGWRRVTRDLEELLGHLSRCFGRTKAGMCVSVT